MSTLVGEVNKIELKMKVYAGNNKLKKECDSQTDRYRFRDSKRVKDVSNGQRTRGERKQMHLNF